MSTFISRGGPMALVLAIACMMSVGCASNSKKSCGDDGVFVHITAGPDDAHSALMGLRMAQMMAADRPVLVYFDVDGINVTLAQTPELKMAPFPSSRQMIAELAKQNVPLYACPGCMKALGKTPEQLLPGVKLAEKDAFFNFTKGRILTLDY